MVAASKYSWAGFSAAFNNEIAFRQIVCVSVIGICCGVCIADGWQDRILLVLPFFFAMMVELLNTAIEATVNRISLEKHPLAKIAKDTASAAQFTAQLFIAVVWGSYLVSKFL